MEYIPDPLSGHENGIEVPYLQSPSVPYEYDYTHDFGRWQAFPERCKWEYSSLLRDFSHNGIPNDEGAAALLQIAQHRRRAENRQDLQVLRHLAGIDKGNRTRQRRQKLFPQRVQARRIKVRRPLQCGIKTRQPARHVQSRSGVHGGEGIDDLIDDDVFAVSPCHRRVDQRREAEGYECAGRTAEADETAPAVSTRLTVLLLRTPICHRFCLPLGRSCGLSVFS